MEEQKTEPLQANVNESNEEWKDEHQLNYAVKGRPAFAFVDVYLKPKQKVFADAGTMLWMDGDVPITVTCCHGGCCNAYMRTCSGETCCQNEFTGPGKVSFGLKLPGDLLPFSVTPGNGWIISHKSFVCGSDNVRVSSRFAGCFACCCGGEGPFVTKVTVSHKSKGMFFAGNYGTLERHEIPAGKSFFVDTGLFFAAHESTSINVGKAGSIAAFCCGGEGFVMKFRGPAVIYTKSRDPSIFNRWQAGGQKPNSSENPAQAAQKAGQVA